ncbi:lipoprotein [Beggiatoa sp. PS]|nr:lipoprotein [Beggiatoa sp. PS]
MKSFFSKRFFFFTGYVSFFLFHLLLSGCGFHLRGAAGFDFSLVHIKSTSANQVALEVGHRLMDEGVKVVPTASAAQIVLHLDNETADNRVLTVSSFSGKLEEIELNVRVNMEVHKPDGTVLLEKQRLSLLRDYSFDETAMLAMWTEAEVLRKEMFQDVVAQILRRLQMLKIGKIELSELAFDGLKSKYAVGERLAVELVESTKRVAPIDIWLSLLIGKHHLFVTPSKNKAQPWQFHKEPKAWQLNVPVSQTRHRIFDFTLQPKMVGEYTLRAVYTKAGADLDLDNMVSTMRSNIAQGTLIIKK